MFGLLCSKFWSNKVYSSSEQNTSRTVCWWWRWRGPWWPAFTAGTCWGGTAGGWCKETACTATSLVCCGVGVACKARSCRQEGRSGNAWQAFSATFRRTEACTATSEYLGASPPHCYTVRPTTYLITGNTVMTTCISCYYVSEIIYIDKSLRVT